MRDLDDRDYLEPPDNEARAVLECSYCSEDIYEGEDYYDVQGSLYCKECMYFYFLKTAERPEL